MEYPKELFLKSIDNISNIDNSARRTQDRSVNSHTNGSYDEFENEPDTDFILAKNRKWAQDIKSKFENMQNLEIYPVAKDILKPMIWTLIKFSINLLTEK